jgi:hypothetical protein
MSDPVVDWDRLRQSKFATEAVALTVFGGLVVLLVGPTFLGYWLAVGALAGAVYWTAMYDARLDGIRDRVPAEHATMLVGFLFVVLVVELLDGVARRSSLVAGFVVGFVVAGVVDALQRRLVDRIESAREDTSDAADES